MFGGDNKLKEETYDINNIEHLLEDELNEGEESDLNDPDLLAQLQALASENDNKTVKIKKTTTTASNTTKAMDIDWEAYSKLTQAGDDVNVELNESDLTDPNLLKELSAIGGSEHAQSSSAVKKESVQQVMNMGFSEAQAINALERFDQDVERATNFLLDAPSSSEDSDNQQQQDTLMEDSDHLKQQAKQYQQRALTAKRQGDKKQAVALLRESKLLMRQHELIENRQHDSEPDMRNQTEGPVENHLSPTSTANISATATNSAMEEEDSLTSKDDHEMAVSVSASETVTETIPQARSPSDTLSPSPPSTSLAAPTAVSIKAQQELLQRVILLQKEYKNAAHHYKDIGNLLAVKEMVKVSKSLLKTAIQLKQQQQQQHEVEAIARHLPGHPDLSLGDGKLRQLHPITEFNQPTTEQIEAQLTYQIDTCHNLHIQHQSSASKNSLSQQQHHDALLPLKQAFAADQMTVRALREQGGNIPSLHWEQVNYVYKNILDHLPLNQMELKIIQGTGIQSLDIGTAVEPFVTWDFAGWPPENTAQAQLNKGETPVMKGTEPMFDFTVLIPITRTNRAFMRHLQRKKMVLEVFHNKYSFGFLRRPISIGKVIIPLDTLLTKAAISGWFDLTDMNRKKTGGRLKIQLGLREPLTGQDMVKRSERWLVLDGFSQQTSQLMYAASLTESPYTPPPSSSASSPTPAAGIPTSPPSASVTAAFSIPAKETVPAEKPQAITHDVNATDNIELENAEDEINNVDLLVSNMVLEYELNVVTAALSKGDGITRTKEDWLDRKQALDIKMNMLVIQVQTGILDMQTYLDNVEKRMNRDRQLALIFKKYNRLDLAKLALTRRKIMQDELDEARAAMASQENAEEL